MEALVSVGKIKEIGLSNFSAAKIVPAVNQVELHPYMPQNELVSLCKSKGVHITGHSPLGGKPVPNVALQSHLPWPLQDKLISSIADRLSVSPATLLLKWALQRGTSVTPKTNSYLHIRENLSTLEMADLSIEDLALIATVRTGKGDVRFMDASKYWGFDIFNSEKDEP